MWPVVQTWAHIAVSLKIWLPSATLGVLQIPDVLPFLSLEIAVWTSAKVG